MAPRGFIEFGCTTKHPRMQLCQSARLLEKAGREGSRVWLREVSAMPQSKRVGGTRASLIIKKDNTELADGFMVLNKAGTPLEGQPKCVTLSQVEAELGNNVSLYAHAITRRPTKVQLTPSQTQVAWVPQRPHAPAVGSEGQGSGLGVGDFEAAVLGQFLCAHEDTEGVAPQCKGLVRPVFEMKVGPGPAGSAQGAYTLMPVAPAGRSALWLFTTKKIEVPGKSFVFLG